MKLNLIDLKQDVYMKAPTGGDFDRMKAFHEKNESEIRDSSYIAMCAVDKDGKQLFKPESYKSIREEWTLRDQRIAVDKALELCGMTEDFQDKVKNE